MICLEWCLGMGIVALWGTEQNWVEVIQDQGGINALEGKTTQIYHKSYRVYCSYIVV